LRQKSLGEGLQITNDRNFYTIFREQISGLEFIRNNRELYDQGLFISLDAYKHAVFLDFREVQDDERRQYYQLTEYLNGRGVPSIDEAQREIFLQPIHTPFNELVNSGQLQWLIDNRASQDDEYLKANETVFCEVEDKVVNLLSGIKERTGASGDPYAIAKETSENVQVLLQFPILKSLIKNPRSRKYKAALKYIDTGLPNQPAFHKGDHIAWCTLLNWIFTHNLGKIINQQDYVDISRAWIDEWNLGKNIANTLKSIGISEEISWRSVGIIKILINQQDWYDAQIPKKQRAYIVLQSWLRDNEFQQFLGVNRYQDVLWFNREAFQEILWWMYLASLIKTCRNLDQSELVSQEIIDQYDVINRLLKSANESGYQVEELLESVKN
jgi:hypothetical protein